MSAFQNCIYNGMDLKKQQNVCGNQHKILCSFRKGGGGNSLNKRKINNWKEIGTK